MSEIKGRAKQQIVKHIKRNRMLIPIPDLADLILSIPELAEGLKAVEKGYNAKVDRKAELPENPVRRARKLRECRLRTDECPSLEEVEYWQAQRDMIGKGYVLEIKE